MGGGGVTTFPLDAERSCGRRVGVAGGEATRLARAICASRFSFSSSSLLLSSFSLLSASCLLLCSRAPRPGSYIAPSSRKVTRASLEVMEDWAL